MVLGEDWIDGVEDLGDVRGRCAEEERGRGRTWL